MRCTDSFLPLNEKADVRAATRKPGVRASALRISSVMPSLKYSLSLSALMLTNGSTAMDFWSAALGAPEAAGGGFVAETSGLGRAPYLRKSRRPTTSSATTPSASCSRRCDETDGCEPECV